MKINIFPIQSHEPILICLIDLPTERNLLIVNCDYKKEYDFIRGNTQTINSNAKSLL